MSKKTIFLPVAYFAVVSIFLIWHGKFFSPDQFFAAAILINNIFGINILIFNPSVINIALP